MSVVLLCSPACGRHAPYVRACLACFACLLCALLARRYVAVVKGGAQPRQPGESGTIELALEGRPAVTDFRFLSCHARGLWLVELWPRTGRTHQLRKHMAYTGTPILGDPRYRGPRCVTGTETAPHGATAAATAAAVAQAEGFQAPLGAGLEVEEVAHGTNDLDKAEADEGEEEGEEGVEEGGDVGDAAQGVGQRLVSSRQRHDLHDLMACGRPAPLCLWAVRLSFMHPATGQGLDVTAVAHAQRVFAEVLGVEMGQLDLD